MDATQGLATILRDGACAPPQDEVGDIFRALKAAIQYSEASMMKSRSRSVLDTPLEPVIGLAEGETRWRGMTIFARSGLSRRRPRGEGGSAEGSPPFFPSWLTSASPAALKCHCHVWS